MSTSNNINKKTSASQQTIDQKMAMDDDLVDDLDMPTIADISEEESEEDQGSSDELSEEQEDEEDDVDERSIEDKAGAQEFQPDDSESEEELSEDLDDEEEEEEEEEEANEEEEDEDEAEKPAKTKKVDSSKEDRRRMLEALMSFSVKDLNLTQLTKLHELKKEFGVDADDKKRKHAEISPAAADEVPAKIAKKTATPVAAAPVAVKSSPKKKKKTPAAASKKKDTKKEEPAEKTLSPSKAKPRSRKKNGAADDSDGRLNPDGSVNTGWIIRQSTKRSLIPVKMDDLTNFMKKRENFDSAMAALQLEYATTARPSFVRDAALAAIEAQKRANEEAGDVGSEIKTFDWDANNVDKRCEMLRSYEVRVAQKRSLPLAPQTKRDNPLLSTDPITAKMLKKIDPEFVEEDLESATRRLEKKRAAATAENERMRAEWADLSPAKRAEAAMLVRRVMVRTVLTPVPTANMLPYVPAHSEAPLANDRCFVIHFMPNGTGAGKTSVFLLDKKRKEMFFTTNIILMSIVNGVMPPDFSKNKSVGTLVLGHILCDKITSALKSLHKDDPDALADKMDQFCRLREAFYFGDSVAHKAAAFKALFDWSPPLDWFEWRASTTFPMMDAEAGIVTSRDWLIANSRGAKNFKGPINLATGQLDQKQPEKKKAAPKKNGAAHKKDKRDDDDDEERGDGGAPDNASDGEGEDSGADANGSQEDADADGDADAAADADADADDDDDAMQEDAPEQKKKTKKAAQKPKAKKARATKRKHAAIGGSAKAGDLPEQIAQELAEDSAPAPEARLLPGFFFIDTENAPDAKFDALAGQLAPLEARLNEAVPVRTNEQAVVAFSVSTQESNTTSAKTIQRKVGKGKKAARGKSANKNDDEDDDEDDDEEQDPEEEVGADESDAPNAKFRLTDADWKRRDEIHLITGISKRRLRHIFVVDSDAAKAEEIEADFKGERLALSDTERELVQRICVELRDKYRDLPKDTDKTKTVQKAKVTLASSRLVKPRRGQLTEPDTSLGTSNGGAIRARDLKRSLQPTTCPLAKAPSAKSFYQLKLVTKAIDPHQVPTYKSLVELRNRWLRDGALPAADQMRIVRDESLLRAYVMRTIEALYERGDLIQGDIDISNLPHVGRCVAEDCTGFDDYVANCMLMSHALALLASMVRADTPSRDLLQRTLSQIVALPAGEDFCPTQFWQRTNPHQFRNEAEAGRLAARFFEQTTPLAIC